MGHALLGSWLSGRRLSRGVRGVETRLDEILALWFGDEGLELGCGERVDVSCLTGHKKKHLRPSECAQLVGLHSVCVCVSKRVSESKQSRFIIQHRFRRFRH